MSNNDQYFIIMNNYETHVHMNSRKAREIKFTTVIIFFIRISEYHPRKYYLLLELRHLQEINKIGSTIRGYDNFLLGLLVKQQTVEMRQLR